jgi:hypothetical protein
MVLPLTTGTQLSRNLQFSRRFFSIFSFFFQVRFGSWHLCLKPMPSSSV